MPMTGKDNLTIKREMENHKFYLNNCGYDVIHSFFEEECTHTQVTSTDNQDRNSPYFLGKSIEKLALADLAFFAKGWEQSNGCVVEHLVCQLYKIPCAYE